jgi:hypothetical protein
MQTVSRVIRSCVDWRPWRFVWLSSFAAEPDISTLVWMAQWHKERRHSERIVGASCLVLSCTLSICFCASTSREPPCVIICTAACALVSVSPEHQRVSLQLRKEQEQAERRPPRCWHQAQASPRARWSYGGQRWCMDLTPRTRRKGAGGQVPQCIRGSTVFGWTCFYKFLDNNLY